MTCAECGSAATQRYRRARVAIDICDRCADRLAIQDAAEARLIEFDQLLSAKKYGDALAILDELWAEHAARDHDGWLERSLLAHRALILGEAGDLDGAIAAQLGVLERVTAPADLASEGLALAALLERAGQLDDAAFASERALDHATGSAAPTAIPLLERYASIQRARDAILPERYRGSLETALAYWGVAADATEPLDAAIARAGRALRDAQARFVTLNAEIARLRDDPAARAAAIRRYVAAEPVGWFRQRAQELVEE